jgi:hypothetical protein
MCLRFVRSVVIALFMGFKFTAAAEVLDQQNDVSPSAVADSTSGGFQEIAQTFTVGVTGTLSRIEVQINWPGFGSPGDAILNVYHTSDGVPNDRVGGCSIPSSGIPSTGFGFQSFDVSSFAIPVSAGEVLAFGITSSENTYIFVRSTFDHSTYAGGESFHRALRPTGPWGNFTPTHDNGFKTYVLAAAGIDGDFNNDGRVDAADYISLRKQYDNIATGPGLTAYQTWRTNFGRTSSGSGASAAVPEPAALVLLMMAATIICAWSRRSRT